MLEEIKLKIEQEIEKLMHEMNFTLPLIIRKAVELGDLRENAEYKSAKERQEFVQARIGHLSQRMTELSKIDVTQISKDCVGFGSKVTVKDMNTKQDITYTIAAGDFIDLDAGHISMASAIGRALMGRKLHEEVVVNLPAGERRYLVTELVTLPEMLKD
jgi:transcription elongation factor GreA